MQGKIVQKIGLECNKKKKKDDKEKGNQRYRQTRYFLNYNKNKI